MEKVYFLPNRDGMKVWLDNYGMEDKQYLFRTEKEYPIQITYEPNHKDKIVAIDPSGGPMLCVGSPVGKDALVSKIEWVKGKGFIITLN